jgi:UDP-2-acetamido-3-amino-2,3-dideoxy-glucuronate N-acetyltransferase
MNRFRAWNQPRTDAAVLACIEELLGEVRAAPASCCAVLHGRGDRAGNVPNTIGAGSRKGTEMTDVEPAAVHPAAFVHPSAEVEPGATIGPGTRVWRRVHIREGAAIGADVQLGANVFVDAGVRIGDRVKVQNNVSVYAGVELADEAFVGPAAVFTNDLNPRATGDWQLMPTFVRRGASVGANATIVCGVELGEHCLVAAGAVVTKDVAPHQLVLGNPARPAGWVCRCGAVASRERERPAGLTCEECTHGKAGDR